MHFFSSRVIYRPRCGGRRLKIFFIFYLRRYWIAV